MGTKFRIKKKHIKNFLFFSKIKISEKKIIFDNNTNNMENENFLYLVENNLILKKIQPPNIFGSFATIQNNKLIMNTETNKKKHYKLSSNKSKFIDTVDLN